MSTRSSSYYSKRSSQQSSVSAQYSSTRPSNENLLDSPTTVVKSISQKSSSSSSTLVVSNSSHSIVSRQGFDTSIDEVPAIPPKNKRKTENRQPSPYDNVPELDHSLGKKYIWKFFYRIFLYKIYFIISLNYLFVPLVSKSDTCSCTPTYSTDLPVLGISC